MSNPDDEGTAATPAPRKHRPGTVTRELKYAREDEREARSGERAARDQLATSLEKQLSIERNKNKWMFRAFMAMFLMVLTMLGTSVGLVKSGTISIPGLWTVEVGTTESSEEIPDHPHHGDEGFSEDDTAVD